MHDGPEGIIAFFLKQFFIYCVNNKVIVKDKIVEKIRDFNYGFLNKKNLPSVVHIGSSHLNNNATQLYCIFIHLPFIFIELKDELKDVWPVLRSLLRCMQVIYSSEINEKDLIELEKQTTVHLLGVIDVFGVKLIPKHHFLLHYPRVIRALGPVAFMCMMRFESKHKFFTDLAKKNK